MVNLSDRFWSKVAKGEPDACWEWQAGRDRDGYGSIRLGGKGSKQKRAHRLSWELHNGAIPDGLVVRHCCDNPSCVNPAHLELGTVADNNRDRADRHRSCKGVNHHNCKLTPEQVEELRRSEEGTTALAVRYGVTRGHVWKLRQGHRRAA